MDARSVNPKVLDRLAASGQTVAIQPGGIPEQLQADSEREVAVFPPRLGFIRLAMRHGIPLLPVYVFGENQAYDTCGRAGQALSQAVYRATGFPMVPVTGKWGVPWLVPRKVDVHIRWGKPVPTAPANADPTDAEVEAVFDRYVAARGLTVVKRTASKHSGDEACTEGRSRL